MGHRLAAARHDLHRHRHADQPAGFVGLARLAFAVRDPIVLRGRAIPARSFPRRKTAETNCRTRRAHSAGRSRSAARRRHRRSLRFTSSGSPRFVAPTRHKFFSSSGSWTTNCGPGSLFASSSRQSRLVCASLVTIEMACGSTPALCSASTAPRTMLATHGTALVDRNRHAIARHDAGRKRRKFERRGERAHRRRRRIDGDRHRRGRLARSTSVARSCVKRTPSPSAREMRAAISPSGMECLDQVRLDAGCWMLDWTR